MTTAKTHREPDREPEPERAPDREDDDRRGRRPPEPEDEQDRRGGRNPPVVTPHVAAPSTSSSGARYDATLNQYVRSEVGGTFSYTGDGALPLTSGVHRIMKTSVASLSLATPTAGDEGCLMVITAGTAFAHLVQLAEGIGGKGGVGGAFDVISFAAVGDTITLRAVNGHWVPEGAPYGAVIS